MSEVPLYSKILGKPLPSEERRAILNVRSAQLTFENCYLAERIDFWLGPCPASGHGLCKSCELTRERLVVGVWLRMRAGHCTCGLISPCSGRDCVKTRRSS